MGGTSVMGNGDGVWVWVWGRVTCEREGNWTDMLIGEFDFDDILGQFLCKVICSYVVGICDVRLIVFLRSGRCIAWLVIGFVSCQYVLEI
jgi:hypothetical protein